MTEHSFILGNGKTRLNYDIDLLKSIGKVYACNRAYEDFIPDVLVSVDKDIAHEIQQNGYSAIHDHYTRAANIIKYSGAIPIAKNYGFSSGPVALTIAAMNGTKNLFMIGMDLISDTKNINNLYSDRLFYKTSDSHATYHGNWVTQIQGIIKEHLNQTFYHVGPLSGYTPEEWKMCNNFCTLENEEFLELINTTNKME